MKTSDVIGLLSCLASCTLAVLGNVGVGLAVGVVGVLVTSCVAGEEATHV